MERVRARVSGMGGLFICYRRDDTAPYARLLSESLADHFGRDAIYRDLDSMAPGVDFPKAVTHALETCDVLLALIGPNWLSPGAEGARRLDDPTDYVRIEIATALRRDDVLVVPVLIESTRMPARRELPEELAGLADRQAHRLADEGWKGDLEDLVVALEKAVPSRSPPPAAAGTSPTKARRRPRLLIAVGAVASVVLVTLVLLNRPDLSPSGDASAVTPCSFGPVRLSAAPLARFDGGFSLTVRVDNTTGDELTMPPSRDVFVLDDRRAVLDVGEPSTWSTVWPVDVPPRTSFERSVTVRGDSGDLPASGSTVGVRVEGVYATGSGPKCTLTVDGVAVP